MIERYSRPEMRNLWTEDAKYATWAKVERAHLETMVERREAPEAVLEAFDKALPTKNAADFLRREQETGHDVIAFIAEIGGAMGDHGRFLHRGLTSSDVLDSSMGVRMNKSLDVLIATLEKVRTNLAEQSYKHAHTLCVGRTHGIHAEPLSFGQVLSSHFAEFQRAHLDLLAARKQMSVGKLSGAVGQYSQLGPDFEARVMNRLDLTPEPVATQVVPRDRLLRVAHAIENAANAVDRFGTNMRHWARTELSEVLEPFSVKQKGSSAMPHKRNPVLAENLCGLARTVRGYSTMLSQNVALWHERDISHSSVERVALPDLFITADFMLDRTASLVQNMQVRPDVMAANLARLGGLWASQSVLTELTENGMNRTEAYEFIQKIALPIAERSALGRVDADEFLNKLLADKHVTDLVGTENLKNIFKLERFTHSVSPVFKRVFGIVPADYERRKNQAVENAAAKSTSKTAAKISEFVPSLQRVYQVTVELLPDVLDTEAKTIENDLRHAGANVASLRQARVFTVRDADLSHAELLAKYAKEVLHNPVIETVRIEVVQ